MGIKPRPSVVPVIQGTDEQVEEYLSKASLVRSNEPVKSIKSTDVGDSVAKNTSGSRGLEKSVNHEGGRKALTVRLPPDIIKSLKIQAAETEASVQEVVERIFRQHLG